MANKMHALIFCTISMTMILQSGGSERTLPRPGKTPMIIILLLIIIINISYYHCYLFFVGVIMHNDTDDDTVITVIPVNVIVLIYELFLCYSFY